MSDKKTMTEEIKVQGENLLAKVKELIHEGNVRSVSLKNEEGRTLLMIPVNAGLAVGALAIAMAPVLVGVGAIAAVVSNVTIVVERDTEPTAK